MSHSFDSSKRSSTCHATKHTLRLPQKTTARLEALTTGGIQVLCASRSTAVTQKTSVMSSSSSLRDHSSQTPFQGLPTDQFRSTRRHQTPIYKRVINILRIFSICRVWQCSTSNCQNMRSHWSGTAGKCELELVHTAKCQWSLTNEKWDLWSALLTFLSAFASWCRTMTHYQVPAPLEQTDTCMPPSGRSSSTPDANRMLIGYLHPHQMWQSSELVLYILCIAWGAEGWGRAVVMIEAQHHHRYRPKQGHTSTSQGSGPRHSRSKSNKTEKKDKEHLVSHLHLNTHLKVIPRWF